MPIDNGDIPKIYREGLVKEPLTFFAESAGRDRFLMSHTDARTKVWLVLPS